MVSRVSADIRQVISVIAMSFSGPSGIARFDWQPWTGQPKRPRSQWSIAQEVEEFVNVRDSPSPASNKKISFQYKFIFK